MPASAADVDPAAIGTASTPAQHQQLAKQYRELAEASRTHAKHHRSMAASYAPGKWDQMRKHCEKLVESFDTQATEYDALAAAHEAAAKK
jgi:hypothetical protein